MCTRGAEVYLQSMNFLAHLNARFPYLVLLFWFVLFGLALPFASQVGSRFDPTGGGVKNSEWQRVLTILATDFNQPALDSMILVSDSSLAPQDPKFLAAYRRLIAKIQTLEGITSITRFDDQTIPLARIGQVDQRFISVTLIANQYGFPGLLEQVRTAARAAAPPDTRFFLTGASAVNQDFAHQTEKDVRQGELTALPLTAVVLVLAFGALVAAGLPILVGLMSISLTMAALYFVTFLLPVSSFSQSVVTLFGLGAGIDYALLVVSRFREYLAAGNPPKQAALEVTKTAGRAVLLSGLTVAIAMSALLVPDLAVTRSIGIAFDHDLYRFGQHFGAASAVGFIGRTGKSAKNLAQFWASKRILGQTCHSGNGTTIALGHGGSSHHFAVSRPNADDAFGLHRCIWSGFGHRIAPRFRAHCQTRVGG
jgi:putative drug exporter of the RND superfamily